jgi:type IV secretory pathway protease TraF
MSRRNPLSPRAVPAAAVALALAAGLAAAARGGPPLVLINETPSVPRGLYVRSADPELRRGRMVSISQPGVARPYLVSLGVPPDMRLLKRVAAVGGEAVCASPGRLRTPHADVAVSRRDRRGTPLPAWTGCRTLELGEVILLGDTSVSFDSRYFGPVRREAVEGAYREVLRW